MRPRCVLDEMTQKINEFRGVLDVLDDRHILRTYVHAFFLIFSIPYYYKFFSRNLFYRNHLGHLGRMMIKD